MVFGRIRLCPPTILRAYKNGDYTDLTINCGPFTFDVHQVVVCTACDFFKQSLQFGKEAEEKCINLPEDDPEMIRRLITYLYLGDYDPSDEQDIKNFDDMKQYDSVTPAAPAYHSRYHKNRFSGTDHCECLAPNPKNVKQPIHEPQALAKPTDYAIVVKSSKSLEVDNPLTIHATMYALADKYQVSGLGQLAREKFESCLHHHVHSEDFVNAIQITYGATPESNRGLRSVVVKAFRTYFKVEISEIPGVEEKLETIDELSFLLIKSWPTRTEQPKPPVSPFAKSSASGGTLFSGGAFGQPASSSALFGGTPATASSGGLFGSASTTASSSGLFGGASSAARPT